MDASKDYYAILGVLPSIEQTALKAVYLALLKKYHPDVYKGNISDAERITKQLNEAYDVLGDQSKRAEYDALRIKEYEKSGDFAQDKTSDIDNNFDVELENDWSFITEYYPLAERQRLQLQKIAPSLAFTFQIQVISRKLGSKSNELFESMKSEYLTRYFGKNQDIHDFVIYLLEINRKDAALEINNYIRLIGEIPENDKFASNEFIKVIRSKYNIKYETFEYVTKSSKIKSEPIFIDNWFPLILMFWIASLISGIGPFIFTMSFIAILYMFKKMK